MRLRKIILWLLICFSCSSSSAYAKDASISIDPAKGSINQPSSISIVIDGGEKEFNAVQVKIDIPADIVVSSITPGNCDFSFIKAPTNSNPSFSGILLGKSSQKCTAFAMEVHSQKKNVVIHISESELLQYGNAQQIHHIVIDGKYNEDNNNYLLYLILGSIIILEFWLTIREIEKDP